MKLETEFRLYLERQKLERAFCAPCEMFPSQENVIPVQPSFTASTWVKLLMSPNLFDADEALLLCQCADDQWLAWIPNHGEVMLGSNQFCWDS